MMKTNTAMFTKYQVISLSKALKQTKADVTTQIIPPLKLYPGFWDLPVYPGVDPEGSQNLPPPPPPRIYPLFVIC